MYRLITSILQTVYVLRYTLFSTLIVLACGAPNSSYAQTETVKMEYSVSALNATTHSYHVVLRTSGWKQDTLKFKLPNWMPGYYQIMNYARNLNNVFAKEIGGELISLNQLSENMWQAVGVKNKVFTLEYDVTTAKQFVANSYVDSEHAYLIPEATFLYVDGFLKMPVSVKLEVNPKWSIATGLYQKEMENEFSAPNFDILYDCPILMGNLEKLPSFKVNGIEHRFIGYRMGDFDRKAFMEDLRLIVQAAVNVIGDIPYEQYTFIGIGPGRGGIEHLNNTTVSFDDSQIRSGSPNIVMFNFLAHEYFHHYNVKRIRPFELGPFDYDKGSRTNLLWVSEGLSVYYEYLIVKRAGLADISTLLKDLEKNINVFENNPGKQYQSLVQASYDTWQDGPFGTQGKAGTTISYYQKGPIVGLLLDFAIRHATENRKSLDDVMRYLYWKYYKQEKRGFTDAEFQQACEMIANRSLAPLFEYVYTTKPLDYEEYLNMGGLQLDAIPSSNDPEKKVFTLTLMDHLDDSQRAIFNSWTGNTK